MTTPTATPAERPRAVVMCLRCWRFVPASEVHTFRVHGSQIDYCDACWKATEPR